MIVTAHGLAGRAYSDSLLRRYSFKDILGSLALCVEPNIVHEDLKFPDSDGNALQSYFVARDISAWPWHRWGYTHPKDVLSLFRNLDQATRERTKPESEGTSSENTSGKVNFDNKQYFDEMLAGVLANLVSAGVLRVENDETIK